MARDAMNDPQSAPRIETRQCEISGEPNESQAVRSEQNNPESPIAKHTPKLIKSHRAGTVRRCDHNWLDENRELTFQPKAGCLRDEPDAFLQQVFLNMVGF